MCNRAQHCVKSNINAFVQMYRNNLYMCTMRTALRCLSKKTKCKWYTTYIYRYMAFLGPCVTIKPFSVVPKVALALSSRVISCLQGPMWISETLCLPVKLCTFSPRVPQIPSGPANYSPNLLIMWQALWLELGSEVCVSRAGPLTSTVTLGTHPSAGA